MHRYVSVKDSHIGFATFIGPKAKLDRVKIGNYSSIAHNVAIMGDNHPIYTFVSTHSAFYKPGRKPLSFVNRVPMGSNTTNVASEDYDVIIGNDVWIGQDVKIMKGVTIADGSVIGAGAIVTKDTEPFSVNVGIPARKLKYRFSSSEIEALNRIKWWNWNKDEIRKRIDTFMDIEKFVEQSKFEEDER